MTEDQHREFAQLRERLFHLCRTYYRYEEAVALGPQVLELADQLLQDNDPRRLAILNNLATAYQRLGRYEEAKEMLRTAVQLGHKIFDQDSPELLALLNNLADVYRLQKNYSAAKSLYQLDSVTLPELYAVSDAHFNDFAGHSLDLALVESPTRFDSFLLNTGVGERLKCDNNAVNRLFVEAVLVEECAPQCQRCCAAIG